MMGSGKTTLGKRVAREIGLSFLDLDLEIEQRTGVTVGTIFEFEGEAGFRARESHLLKEVCHSDEGARVVATGGGVVLSPLNRARLQACGYVIYLHAHPSLLYARTKTDRGRPLLQVEDPFAKIVELVARRDPLYREVADIIIEAGQEISISIAQIVAAIYKQ